MDDGSKTIVSELMLKIKRCVTYYFITSATRLRFRCVIGVVLFIVASL